MKCSECGNNFKGKFCPNCGTPAKPIYKKWWFWLMIAVVAIIGISAVLGNNDDNADEETGKDTGTISTDENTVDNNKVKVTVADFSTMNQTEIQNWADANKITCKFSEDYADSIPKGSVISQSKNAGEEVDEGSTVQVVISLGQKPPEEFLNARVKAEMYSKNMHMSKAAIYNQLTSEYGEKFPADAAQYAIENMKADWNENALKKAESYQKNMHMSKKSIYNQLISEYGEKFTPDEAQYAIDHIQADWNETALQKAKSYQENMHMSKSAIYDQLISEYGEKFTPEEAQYAIDHLEN